MNLQAYILSIKPTNRHSSDEIMRYLQDGEIVTFKLNQPTFANAEFYINDDPNRIIWASQLQRCFFTQDFTTFYLAGIRLQGKEEEPIRNYSIKKLCDVLCNHRFEVMAIPNILAVNENSNVIKEHQLFDAQKIQDFAKKCARENKCELLGDLFKPGTLYDLVEFNL